MKECAACGKAFQQALREIRCLKCKVATLPKRGAIKAGKEAAQVLRLVRAEEALAKAGGLTYKKMSQHQRDINGKHSGWWTPKQYDFTIYVGHRTKQYAVSVGRWRKRAHIAMVEEGGKWRFVNRCWRNPRDRARLKQRPLGTEWGLKHRDYTWIGMQEVCDCVACEDTKLFNSLLGH